MGLLDDKVAIDFSISEFASVDLWPKKGDRIVLIDRCERPEFEVVFADGSGHGRVTFRCVRTIPK